MITAVLQLSEFVLAAWLLFRFVDRCYRRNLNTPDVSGAPGSTILTRP